MAISLGIYPIFRQTHISFHIPKYQNVKSWRCSVQSTRFSTSIKGYLDLSGDIWAGLDFGTQNSPLNDYPLRECCDFKHPSDEKTRPASTMSKMHDPLPIGSMYAIYGNIYHQYTPNVSIYTIHGSYGHYDPLFPWHPNICCSIQRYLRQ